MFMCWLVVPIFHCGFRCEEVLQQFSIQIRVSTEKRNQGLSEDDFAVDFAAMTNILILHSQAKGEAIELNIIWHQRYYQYQYHYYIITYIKKQRFMLLY